MDTEGNLRLLTPAAPLRSDEVVIPENELVHVQAMTRQQRRAWYRAQKKKGATPK